MNRAHTIHWACHFIPLVVVDNLDFGWSYISPEETNSPLVIYANTVLAFPITLECFKTVTRRGSQKVQCLRCVEL